nr:DEAD/DEAH box helicase [Colwellia maritima]
MTEQKNTEQTDSKNSTEQSNAVSFDSLGLPTNLLTAVTAIGFTSATDIQAQTIPPLLAGKDVLGEAQTGTGKTAAFGLPVSKN